MEINGKKICVGKFNEQLFAFAYQCPHAGGLLAYGHIDALGNVVCPMHAYKFNIQTGRNVTGEGFFLKRWQVVSNHEGIFIEGLPGA